MNVDVLYRVPEEQYFESPFVEPSWESEAISCLAEAVREGNTEVVHKLLSNVVVGGHTALRKISGYAKRWCMPLNLKYPWCCWRCSSLRNSWRGTSALYSTSDHS